MHPQNPYNVPPDFSALAEKFPPLRAFVTTSTSGKSTINFQDPDAQRTLTQALLKCDFDITVSLPENRLCPAVPNRLNYILWIQDVLFPFDQPSNQPIRGLDIGTGASAIYPILACSLSQSTREWSFVATEIDPLSASFASRNVEVNGLSSRIKVWEIIQTSTTGNGETFESILAPLIEEPESAFDFTMCNPPFYDSMSEMVTSSEAKELPPNGACTGAEVEMITHGGETGFVLRMLRESARESVRHRCRWFTSMLGKLSSVGVVVEELRKLKINNYALTQFIQGTTRRWAVGWSFGDGRLPDTIACPASSSLSGYIPGPTTLRQSFVIPPRTKMQDCLAQAMQCPCDIIRSTLSQILTSIDGLEIRDFGDMEKNGRWRIDVKASENTWSRAARRKQKQSISPSVRMDETSWLNPFPSPTHNSSENAPSAFRTALHCQIRLLDSYERHLHMVPGPVSPHVTLEIQWVRGVDRSMFEGFWSHVCRKMKAKL